MTTSKETSPTTAGRKPAIYKGVLALVGLGAVATIAMQPAAGRWRGQYPVVANGPTWRDADPFGGTRPCRAAGAERNREVVDNRTEGDTLLKKFRGDVPGSATRTTPAGFRQQVGREDVESLARNSPGVEEPGSYSFGKVVYFSDRNSVTPASPTKGQPVVRLDVRKEGNRVIGNEQVTR